MLEHSENTTSAENEDYYLENGLLVFTASYLRKRGYCCKSGCRHCPYGFKKNLEDQAAPAEEEG